MQRIKKSKDIYFDYLLVYEVLPTDPRYSKWCDQCLNSYSFLLYDEENKKTYIKTSYENCLVLEVYEKDIDGKAMLFKTLKCYIRSELPEVD